MRDETNIKTNFLGRDGFRLFIGQIPKNNKEKYHEKIIY